jgi:CBS domain containing-hemolysin-like protein
MLPFAAVWFDISWKILATLGLVALNGFFVAAEFAAVGARTSRIAFLAESGNLFSRLALNVKHNLALYLSTCQLGITIASLALGYVTEPAVAALLESPLEAMGFHAPDPTHHHWIAIAIALAISTSLHVVVGEVAPKNLSILYPDRILPLLALPLVACTVLLYPAIWALNSASNLLLKACGVPIDDASHGSLPHTANELRALLRLRRPEGSADHDAARRGRLPAGRRPDE